jgi:16S rRNA G527 N7-methylase RsmG
MLLLESHRKKASFLKVVLSKLILPKVCVLQERWEELARSGHPSLKHPPKLATMRAIRLKPEHLLAASMILDQHGIFAWWAGPAADLKWHETYERAFEKAGMIFKGRYTYSLPSTSQPRYLFIWWKRSRKVT